MPLSEKLRIELYLPDSPSAQYPRLTHQMESEISHTFGGCSVVQGIKGLYRARGALIQDRIDLVFTDTDLSLDKDRDTVAFYVDTLAEIIAAALNEESILIAVYPVTHHVPKDAG